MKHVSISALGLLVATTSAAQTKRPMTFMDAQLMKTTGAPAFSPDGKWLLYTLSSPDWKEAKRFTDVWIVSTEQGAPSARQLTFTKTKNESNPRWSADGTFFIFSSNRDAADEKAGEQLYVMRPDGGEARKVTDAKDGVRSFRLTRDGRWLVFLAGKPEEAKLWSIPAEQLAAGEPKATQISQHSTPITDWEMSHDGKQVFFRAKDTVDADEKARMEKKFDVRIRNQNPPIEHLWVLDLATAKEKRLTGGTEYSVVDFTVSKNGKWVGFRGAPNDRYKRTVTESGNYDDLYLLESASGKIERLTNNEEIGESELSFSPDGKWIAYSASNDFVYSRDPKVYLRAVDQPAAPWRKLGAGYDGALSVDWWSNDGGTIYFTSGVKATLQLMALDVAKDAVSPVTSGEAVIQAEPDLDTGLIRIVYEDGSTPGGWFLARSAGALGNRASWVRLTEPNPEAANWALGAVEEISWKSKDGATVGGVLVKPVGYQTGRRYPLIVQIHGGPAAADYVGFNDGYGSQIYAGAGYAVLLPNYRGSANYGERHRMETAGVGKYFARGFDDIMSGVDYLIAQGIAAPDSLGAMGWSAGGHYSNWILTHTDRFKAISSGAGTMNWISMYAQSDIQRNRQWYMGGRLPYEDFDAYWLVSPLKYIKNAKTPTLIHVVDGDPRVPRPQSEELHMALKKLGVPTEFFVYPGTTHGIAEPHNQLVKAIAEFKWFEKWIRGKPGWFTWRELLDTVADSAKATTADGTKAK